MKLQDQVCTLEQANKLYELGVKGGSEFYYRDNRKPETLRHVTHGFYGVCAFTVSELGVMLPNEQAIIGWECWYSDHIGAWYCTIRDFVKWKGGAKPPPVAYEAEEETMAAALADALIHCLENKLTTSEEVNNRLSN